MKQYLITGLCKREYRGKGRDTTLQTTVDAANKEEAGAIYEKANPEYSAASIAEVPKSKAKDIRDDGDMRDDGDTDGEYKESGK